MPFIVVERYLYIRDVGNGFPSNPSPRASQSCKSTCKSVVQVSRASPRASQSCKSRSSFKSLSITRSRVYAIPSQVSCVGVTHSHPTVLLSANQHRTNCLNTSQRCPKHDDVTTHLGRTWCRVYPARDH